MNICPHDDPLAYHMRKVDIMLRHAWAKGARSRAALEREYRHARERRRQRLLARREVLIALYGGVIGTPLLIGMSTMLLIAMTGMFPDMFDTSGAWTMFAVCLLPFFRRDLRRATWLYHATNVK